MNDGSKIERFSILLLGMSLMCYDYYVGVMIILSELPSGNLRFYDLV